MRHTVVVVLLSWCDRPLGIAACAADVSVQGDEVGSDIPYEHLEIGLGVTCCGNGPANTGTNEAWSEVEAAWRQHAMGPFDRDGDDRYARV